MTSITNQNKAKKNFYINEARADTLVKLMYDDYYNNPKIVASKKNLIENQVPDTVDYGSEKHLIFLFLTALNDHGVKSKVMYDKALRLVFTIFPLFCVLAISYRVFHQISLYLFQ